MVLLWSNLVNLFVRIFGLEIHATDYADYTDCVKYVCPILVYQPSETSFKIRKIWEIWGKNNF